MICSITAAPRAEREKEARTGLDLLANPRRGTMAAADAE
jgi:hypothetical protein